MSHAACAGALLTYAQLRQVHSTSASCLIGTERRGAAWCVGLSYARWSTEAISAREFSQYDFYMQPRIHTIMSQVSSAAIQMDAHTLFSTKALTKGKDVRIRKTKREIRYVVPAQSQEDSWTKDRHNVPAQPSMP